MLKTPSGVFSITRVPDFNVYTKRHSTKDQLVRADLGDVLAHGSCG